MALLFMDSFDHYTSADVLEKWSSWFPTALEYGSVPVISLAGRHGSNAVGWTCADYSSRAMGKFLPAASGPTVVVGFAFQQSLGGFGALRQGTYLGVTAWDQTNFLLVIRVGGTAQVWLRINSNGTISVLRGDGSNCVVLGTTVKPLPLQSYVFIEFKMLIDSTNGTIDIHVNNEEWLHLTSQNTQFVTGAIWNEVIIGGIRINGEDVTWNYDDFYVLDGTGPAPWNTFLGDCRVDACYPRAEGVLSAWDPLSGLNNALMVDEQVPDDDVTYNSTTTVGATDTFVVDDAPAGSVVRGVQIAIHTKKADAGPCTIAPMVAGVLGSVTVNPGSGTYAYALFPYAKNPATDLAWTEAEFNAAEFGYKRTA